MPMLKWLGEALTAAREDAGVTQLEVAIRVPPSDGAAHVSPSTISRLEQGRGWPRSDRIDDYLQAYAEATATPTVALWFDAITRWVDGELVASQDGPQSGSPEGSEIPADVAQALALLAKSRAAARNPGATRRQKPSRMKRARRNRIRSLPPGLAL